MATTNVVPTSATIPTELLYKILVIGELGCGKTSFIKRYVHQFFSEHYRATIGVDFALKVVRWDESTVVRLQLWDIAGQERFGNMTRVYYKDAVAAFLLFDVTRADTFAAVHRWKADLDSKVLLPDGRSIPCVLIGNKCDQRPSDGTPINRKEQMNALCREHNFAGWFACSAKENINVDEAADFLITKVMDNERWMQSQGVHVAQDVVDGDLLALHNNDKQSNKGNKCVC